MTGLIFKILIILVLWWIFIQDYKERKVYWFLYLLVLIFGFGIQIWEINYKSVIIETLLNFILILLIIGGGWFYSKFILKKKFVGESIGEGDLFLFISLCFGFPTLSFIVFFVSSLIASLFIHITIDNKKNSVPLAGYMSLFYMIIYLLSLLKNIDLYNFYFTK